MIFILADSTGELCEFASTQALGRFHMWAEEQHGEVSKLASQGYTENLETLAKQLDELDAPEDLQEQRDLLLRYAKTAQDILIISDGEQQDAKDMKTLLQSDNTPLHKAADAFLSKMTLAVAYAFGMGRKAVDKKALAAATSDRDALSALDAAPQAVKDALLKSLPPVLLSALKAGGEVGIEKLVKQQKTLRGLAPQVKGQPHTTIGPFDLQFNDTSAEAIAWAEQHAGELAVGISNTTRDDIADAVASALEGDGIDSAYEDILAAVGDDVRAEMIARTEIMDASNEGLAQSWDQAVEAGLLTGKENKVWIATAGCCDECADLDGEEVPMNEDFSGGDDPPLHPNCRCTMGLAE